MNSVDVFIFLIQALVVFTVGASLFDVVHFVLHQWTNSKIKILKTFAGWHTQHHNFLNHQMKVQGELGAANIIYHVLPEYLTSIAGIAVLLFVFPWAPVLSVLVIRTFMVALVVYQKGQDFNHRSMDRVSGRTGLFYVGQDYHAMHHIFPDNFYSSFVNVFDLLFGTTCQIQNRRFLITGARGALGSALKRQLEKQGAIVETAKFGVDFKMGSYQSMRQKLLRADVLVLAHGSKSTDCWNANCEIPAALIDLFIESSQQRLIPPEVWGLGSEIELHGDFGVSSLKEYSISKKAFSARARFYHRQKSVIYRHIVPSAFTSPMGRGLMSADTAANIALFFIKRGFKYVPVTYTGLAFLNYIPFRLLKATTAEFSEKKNQAA